MRSEDLRVYIIKPVLQYLDMYSKSAENLLLGTCAQESHMGKYLRQVNGPALGIFQMEPTTHDDILINYVNYHPEIKDTLGSMTFNYCAKEMVYNLKYATAMCRLHYRRVTEKLPDPFDVVGLGRYWKRYYNTFEGKGTVEEFVENYRRFVV